MGKGVIRAKNDFELAQSGQVVGEITQLVTRKIEHFQSVGQSKHLLRHGLQAARQIQSLYSSQRATAQLFQCMQEKSPVLSPRRSSDKGTTCQVGP